MPSHPTTPPYTIAHALPFLSRSSQDAPIELDDDDAEGVRMDLNDDDTEVENEGHQDDEETKTPGEVCCRSTP